MDFLCFTANNQEYAISITQAVSVLELIPMTYVPGSAESVRGVFMHRGELVPVIDLSLMYTGVQEVNGRFIIVVEGLTKFGIVIESIGKVVRGDIPEGVLCMAVCDVEQAVKTFHLGDSHIELF